MINVRVTRCIYAYKNYLSAPVHMCMRTQDLQSYIKDFVRTCMCTYGGFAGVHVCVRTNMTSYSGAVKTLEMEVTS